MTNMKFCSIASGSSGNCYFLEVAGKKYLVDAGISFKRIREALASLSVDIGDISGVFITHEHSDHLSGLPMLIKKTGMEIFSSPGTLMEISRKYEEIPFSRLHDLRKCSTNLLDGVRVRPFPVFHDAKDPVGYVFEESGRRERIAIVTDTGRVDETIMEAITGATLLVIEANYDEHTLKNGEYPMFLKRRILSAFGHLSNLEAAKTLHDLCDHQHLRYAFLGHLSKENNLPSLARDAVCRFLDDFQKEITFELDTLSRVTPSKLITL